MFAQGLIYIVLLILFIVACWILFGKRIVKRFSKPEELDLEKERSSLERKIKLLKELADKLEDVKEEIGITGQLGKVQKNLKKYEERLRELDKKASDEEL